MAACANAPRPLTSAGSWLVVVRAKTPACPVLFRGPEGVHASPHAQGSAAQLVSKGCGFRVSGKRQQHGHGHCCFTIQHACSKG